MRFFTFFFIFFNFITYTIKAQEFKVLYFNDAHDLEPIHFKNQQIGGITKLSHFIKKESDDSTFVFFGGDLAGGTLTGKVFKGTVMVKALNEMGIDAANMGQHEFDFGIENFMNLKNHSEFPWVNSNLKSKTGETLSLPYLILNKNGINIGVVGITDKIETSFPGLPIESLNFNEALKGIFKANPEIDFWVALTQMNLELNEKLHAAFPQLKLILTEETYHDRTQIIWHNNTPIIAVSGNIGDVAQIEYHQENQGLIPSIKVHSIRENSPEDLVMQAWVNDSIQSMNQQLSEPVGFAEGAFLKQETKMGERAIGNLVTDAFRSAYRADIAIIQGGGIRAGLQKGAVTKKDIYAILPFENDLILTKLTGKEIKAMLENAIQRLMPQISGMQIKISTKDNKYSIEEIYIDKQPIDLNKKYLVSLPSYIADGGGNFDKIAPHKILKRNLKDAEALKQYISKMKNIHPKTENRIF